MIEKVHTLIAPYVEKDPTKFCTYEEFETGIATLKEFCLLRAESIHGQLEGSIPSTSEEQNQNSESLISADGITISAMGSMNNGQGGMGGPDGEEGRPEGESAPFMEGNPNADASSDSDSSSNSKMNPPGEMPQGDGNNRPDKSDGPPQQ